MQTIGRRQNFEKVKLRWKQICDGWTAHPDLQRRSLGDYQSRTRYWVLYSCREKNQILLFVENIKYIKKRYSARCGSCDCRPSASGHRLGTSGILIIYSAIFVSMAGVCIKLRSTMAQPDGRGLLWNTPISSSLVANFSYLWYDPRRLSNIKETVVGKSDAEFY